MPKIKSVDVIPLRIPFQDGSAGVGLMPSKWTHLDFALTRIETDDGLIGWGDAFAYSCLGTVAAAIRDMIAPLVIGRDVTLTRDGLSALNRDLQLKTHLQGRYGITTFAISAVDIALWDIAGKSAGQSLGALLAGRSSRPRATLPAYASLVRYGDPGAVADYANRSVEEGYRTVKLHEITGETITAGRNAVGEDIQLTTDINCNWSAQDVADLMPLCRELNLYWVEEPIFPPDDADALAALEADFGIAIASGENVCTVVEFARTIPKITFPQPSVTKVGGVTEFLNVCDLAGMHGKTVMPHAPYFGPGYWATVQLTAARQECALFERLYIMPDAYLDPAIPLPAGGDIAVPDRPGLGFEPDPDILARYRVDG